MSRNLEPTKLNHVFEIYVPSKFRSGKEIPADLRSDALDHVKKHMERWFGGGTYIKSVPAEGFWRHETGEIADEDVDVLYSNANAAQFEEFREDFFALAADLANKLDQEAVACRVDGKMFAFHPSPDIEEPQKIPEPGKLISVPPKKIDSYRTIKAALLKLDSMEKARDLFCNVLHYEYASDNLPSFNWPDSITQYLAEGSVPQIIADQNDFKIIYIKLGSKRLLRTEERPIIQRIMHDNPTMRGLLVVSDMDADEWHLVNVKFAADKSGKNRFLIRRMRIAEQEQLRTVVERLSLIDIESIGEDATAADIQTQHDKAFDVQAVTKEFFARYRDVFEDVENRVKGFSANQREERRRVAIFTMIG
jgi:hypothetical protein